MLSILKKLISKRTLVPLAVLGALIPVAVIASHLSPSNGDFETGDLTDWTVFVDPGSTVGTASVVEFDTNGDGDESFAAQLNVGWSSPIDFDEFFACDGPGDFVQCRQNPANGKHRGGGVTQDVTIPSDGTYQISVDVAADLSFTDRSNGQGGYFELVIDGVTASSTMMLEMNFFDFPSTIRDSLGATIELTAGTHSVAVRVSRAWTTEDWTPRQYIDNVTIQAENKADILNSCGVPGKGIDKAPGLDKPFNEKGKGGENAGKKGKSEDPPSIGCFNVDGTPS